MAIAAILESLVEGVVSGKASVSQLRAVAYASRTILAALEAGDVLDELERLKAAVRRIEEA
jgi:hypothetical protein